MKHNLLKTAIYAASLSTAVYSAGAFAGDDKNKDHHHPKTHAQEKYHDNKNHDSYKKQSANDYWKNFKQDADQSWDNSKAAFRDGWVEGKLETAILFNKYLSPFKIDSQVNNDTAILTGTVDSDIDRELAETIALGIEGVDKVDNKLLVSKDKKYKSVDDRKSSGFVQYMKDASITASVKMALLNSDNADGMDINVTTNNANVTLEGEVESEQEKMLAEKIAKNDDDVTRVINRLKVKSKG